MKRDIPEETPRKDLMNEALKHYEEAANAIHHFNSDIPKAIRLYYTEVPQDEPAGEVKECKTCVHYYEEIGTRCIYSCDDSFSGYEKQETIEDYPVYDKEHSEKRRKCESILSKIREAWTPDHRPFEDVFVDKTDSVRQKLDKLSEQQPDNGAEEIEEEIFKELYDSGCIIDYDYERFYKMHKGLIYRKMEQYHKSRIRDELIKFCEYLDRDDSSVYTIGDIDNHIIDEYLNK